MRKWLRNLAGHALKVAADDVLRIGMPADRHFEVPGAEILTPLGLRDRAWLEGAAADGARAIDFFPWWHRGAGARCCAKCTTH